MTVAELSLCSTEIETLARYKAAKFKYNPSIVVDAYNLTMEMSLIRKPRPGQAKAKFSCLGVFRYIDYHLTTQPHKKYLVIIPKIYR